MVAGERLGSLITNSIGLVIIAAIAMVCKYNEISRLPFMTVSHQSRLHDIRGIGVNIHTEGTEEYMDVQMDILSGKLMDLDMLNYVPEIKENPKAMEMIKVLFEKSEGY